jgi:hypothetical protein
LAAKALYGSDLGSIAILQPPTAKIDSVLFRSREPSEHPFSDHGPFELGKDALAGATRNFPTW